MPRKNARFCHDVRNKIEKWRDSFKQNNENYHYWFNFVMGNQWEDQEDFLLRKYGKEPMVMNKLSPLAKFMLGDQRQNTPNLQAIPDKSADVQTVAVRDALIKHITFSSDAKVVYQIAYQSAIIGGYGAYAIDHDYINDGSFEQEPKIIELRDATKAYWDISAATPCKTDGMYAGYITRMSRDAFESTYGEKIARGIGDNYGEVDTQFVWSNDKEIVVIRHQERKIKRDTLYELSNGERITKKELEDSIQTIYPSDAENDTEGADVIFRNDEIVTIERERPVVRSEIKSYKIAGDYILDETEFPADELGVIFVDQNSWWDKKNKQITVPFFNDAYDAQRYLNYLATMSAYIWKVSRYDQYMGSKTNFRSPDTQQIWRDPSTYQGTLIYDVDLEGGTKPERLSPPSLPPEFLTQYQRALDDIHSSTGIYGTQIGQQGAELSGAAVDARTRQGSTTTYVTYDSLNRSLAVGGRIINQMISRLYDTEREVTMELPDSGLQRIKLNEEDEFENVIANNIKDGQYKVRLLPGPSYEGQQQKSIEAMNVVLQADKSGQLFPMIADLYVDNLELNNKIEVKNRLKTIVPPEIIQAGKTGKTPPPKPQQPDPQTITAYARMMEAETKKSKLQQEAQQAAADYQLKIKEIETEQMEAAAQLEETVMRAQAETQRMVSDEQIAHANNIVKILTHLKEPQSPKGK